MILTTDVYKVQMAPMATIEITSSSLVTEKKNIQKDWNLTMMSL